MPPTKRTTKDDATQADERAKDARTPDEQRDANQRADIAPFGSEQDPYGRTNHAMTADEVAAKALEEGTLRPDGRPKQSVFYDDVALEEETRRREFIENQQWNEDGTPVDYAAIAATHQPVVAERGEPLRTSVAVTTPEQLEKANQLAGEQEVRLPGGTNAEAAKGEQYEATKDGANQK